MLTIVRSVCICKEKEIGNASLGAGRTTFCTEWFIARIIMVARILSAINAWLLCDTVSGVVLTKPGCAQYGHTKKHKNRQINAGSCEVLFFCYYQIDFSFYQITFNKNGLSLIK